MDDLNRWEILLLLITAYLAIASLVNLMTARRNQLVSDVQQQINELRRHRKQAGQQQADEPASETSKNAA